MGEAAGKAMDTFSKYNNIMTVITYLRITFISLDPAYMVK